MVQRTRQPGPDIMKYAFNHQQLQVALVMATS